MVIKISRTCVAN